MRRLIALSTLALALAGPASSAESTVRWFYSPSGNIGCEVAAADVRGTYAYCQTTHPPRSVKLRANGRSHVCRGTGCIGNGPENAFKLGYGRSVKVGPFRCTSRRIGMTCLVVRSGHGFELSRERVRTF
jgi:hypothetical protein